MSDAGLPGEAKDLETLEMGDEPTGDADELMIITGGIAEEGQDGEVAPAEEAEPESDAEPADERAEFTLDELVAEMAGVSAVVADAPAAETAAEPVPEHLDPLAAAMSEAFAATVPVEAEMWTRAPFWATGATWAIFVGVLTYLLWPKAAGGLQDAPLYGVLVFGGATLVVVGLVAGLIVWSRARARAEITDRAIVSRAVLLRVLGWTAAGVALWVIAMIVLSLHYLDVIP